MMMKPHKFATSFLVSILFIAWSNGQVLKNPEVTRLAEGFQFLEGPVWVGDSMLLFSDIPANTIYKWTEQGGISTFLHPSGNSNGLAIDPSGRLIMCQHGSRQVGRLESDGNITPLSTHFKGKKLNSPNDLDISSDGSVFFTDPPYGLNDPIEGSETHFNGIYRWTPSGQVQLLDSTVGTPNGIAFSPAEDKLYVSDSEIRIIYVYNVKEDSILTNRQEFARQELSGNTDGMKVDKEGFIYAAGPLGIWIYSPDGTSIDTIEVPGQTTNCTFGGRDGDILFVTSGNSLYKIQNARDSDQP